MKLCAGAKLVAELVFHEIKYTCLSTHAISG